MSSKILSEVIIFFILLFLVSIQVMVYWSCSRSTDPLKHDEGTLIIDNLYYSPPYGSTGNTANFTVLAVSANCYKCNYSFISTIPPQENATFEVDTTYPVHIQIRKEDEIACEVYRHFVEKGVYSIEIIYNKSKEQDTECEFMVRKISGIQYLPILYATVSISVVAVGWIVLVFLHGYIKEKGYFKYFHFRLVDRLTHRLHNNEATALLSRPSIIDQKLKKESKRLTSLDAFRGMSLIIMIFVNYGGGGYWFFSHSKWNGLTVADLVFPWFIWIMGVSLVFSFRGRKKESFAHQFYQIIRRTIILFALGLFLSASSDVPLKRLRIPGVLQRFSVTYLIVALTELVTSYLYSNVNFSFWDPIRDLTNNWVQWVVVLVLEISWLMFTFLLSIDGCPRGYLGPGGISDYGRWPNCTGGAAGGIDRWILRKDHLYDNPTAKDLYNLELNYDPEGILGTLNSIVLCFLGVQAGRTFLHFKGRHLQILIRLTIWGVVWCILGTILCLGQKNDGFIPLNKNLWSLSFILLMGGTGYLVLALFYLTIDVVPIWNGAPFKYQGMNSIVLYMGHEILSDFFPFGVYNQDTNHLTFLTSNLVGVAIWMLISYYWYTVKFFVKI